MKRIRAVVVDDEKLARTRLKRMLSKYDNIQVVGEAENGTQALELVDDVEPDVLFLDIKMPSLSGFELLKRLRKSPHVIFTTAYDEYALQAFEENTVDYLLKPVSSETLDRAVRKLSSAVSGNSVAGIDLERILQAIKTRGRTMRRFAVKLGNQFLIVPDDEIYSFHAEGKYTFLDTAQRDFIIPFTMKELETRIDGAKFARVHRSHIVNIEHVGSIHQWFGGRLLLRMKNGKEVVVSRGYVKEFKQRINL